MELITSIRGTVIHGKALGRTVGMPTANVSAYKEEQDKYRFLKEGVYATLFHCEGETHLGVTNVGRRPTVDSSEVFTNETLILDFDKDIYDKEATVEFYYYIRPVSKFPSLAAVKAQVDLDSVTTRNVLHDTQCH